MPWTLCLPPAGARPVVAGRRRGVGRTVAAAGLATVAALATATTATALAAPEAAWTVAGQQGLVRFVIVPVEAARDRGAYTRQIAQLCEPGRTCFLNFYTNSTGTPVELPLPDAIDKEATAVFRRSEKQRAERFQWSCRMSMSTEPCF